MALSRTQRAINDYLRSEKAKEVADELDLPSNRPVLADPASIKYVDKDKFKKSMEKYKITPLILNEIHKYINESPKANRHYWDFTRGKKSNFQQLIDHYIP